MVLDLPNKVIIMIISGGIPLHSRLSVIYLYINCGNFRTYAVGLRSSTEYIVWLL